MLGCVCRHPLHLAETTERTLLSLPFGLSPTILLRQGNPNGSLQRTLRGMGRPERLIYRDGKPRNISAPLVICSDEPLNAPLNSLEIFLTSGRASTASREALYQAADELQAKMLMYRLKNFDVVKNAIFSAPELNSPYSEMARTFGAAIVDHNDFRSQLFDVLTQWSESSHMRGTNPATTVVVEVALALAHEEGRSKVRVGEIAACANTLLKARGENIQLEDRAVGDLLKKMRVVTEKLGASGRGFKFTKATRRQIHELARAHEVAAAMDGIDRCELCAEVRGPAREPISK